jgi:hypothetical protein
MSSYNKVVKGKLSFKGGKSTGSVKKRPVGESGPRVGTGSQGAAPSASTVRDVPVVEEEMQIMNGTGRFTTSGTRWIINHLYVCFNLLVCLCF